MAATPVASKVVASGQETGASAGGGQDLESVSTQLDRLSRLIRSKARIDVRTLASRHGDLILLLAITALAAFLRLYRLGDIPLGLHGDEAWTGIEADRILDDGWIGVFDPRHGLGQPAGMEYWTAGLVAVFGNSVFVIRAAMAVLGIATVPLLYVLVGMTMNRAAAVFASTLLALSAMHIHYGRIALPPASLPFVEIAALTLFVLAIRFRKLWLFGLAGIMLGAGLYTYSSYALFVGPLALFMLYWLLRTRAYRDPLLLRGTGVMAGLALLAAIPMLSYVRDHQDEYFSYPRSISVFNSSEFKDAAGFLEKTDVVLDSGRDYVRRAIFHGEFDASDGIGVDPLFDRVTAALIGLGALIAFWRWRNPWLLLPVLMLFVLPWAGILSVKGGIPRRTVGVIPFAVVLSALPLALLWEGARRWGPRAQMLALGGTAAVLATVGFLNTGSYFDTFADSREAKFTFAYELAQASHYLDTLPSDTLVYFYSVRWSFQYETRRYLAGGFQGEDRSNEFGQFSLDADRSRNVVYLLLGRYRDVLPDVQALYPGGELYEEFAEDGTYVFQGYFLPRAEGAPSAAASTDSTSPRNGAEP